jgi:hypothetical protein
MTRQTYDLVDEPTGSAYRGLLRTALRYCSEFGLTHQRDAKSLGVERVLRALEPYLISATRSRSWPGNEMAPGYTAEVFRYRLVPDAVAFLESAVQGLYGWTQLDRPEDLHILRADGSVWLGSIAHERDGWLTLTMEELSALQSEAAGLELRRRLAN